MTLQDPHIERLAERHVAVVRHEGSPDTVDTTRRPLYQHMIIHELVGGPGILRFVDEPRNRFVDALVTTHPGFEGDEVCKMEVLPAGRYAVAGYEGPTEGLPAARRELLAWANSRGERPAGPPLQVHLMDAIEGITEQELQVPLADGPRR
ncbi:MAG: GyrI-like domain-containing protein [Thermoplasmatota archaeon]